MNVRFRPATEVDVPSVVDLLSDDVLGQGREMPDLEVYIAAFRKVASEPHNHLIVGEYGAEIVACYQLSLITGVSRRATCRAQIEGVRVASDRRGQGIGAALMQDAEKRAQAAGAGLMQFTSSAIRDRAHSFYERLGYEPSHIGFKKSL